MMHNRSVPTSTMLAHVTCEDIPAAVAWLEAALGFQEHFRYGDPVAGVQMHRGGAWIMLNAPRTERATPAHLGRMTQSLTIVVADVDAAFAQATAAGAPVVEDLNETEYGERQFVVADPDGHRWLIAQHVRDVAPEAWGAIPRTG